MDTQGFLISNWRKFVVAVVGAVVLYAHQHGVTVADSISVEVIGAVTAFGVGLIRNGFKNN